MAWTAPADPVAGTVITVAYAQSNILDPIRWLRIMTGNSDPPGSAYALISASVSGTAWSKIPADALASGAVVGHLGYVPVNRAGDGGMTGNFVTTGAFAGLALNAGVNGVTTQGGVTSNGNISAPVSTVSGGALAAGTGGITSGGNITAAISTIRGGALSASTGGISSDAGISAVGAITSAGHNVQDRAWHTGTQVASTISNFAATVATLDAASVAGKVPTATPGGGALPLADPSGKLDAWVTPTAFSIPSKLGFWVRNAADIPVGFSRDTTLDGLLPIGAGTSFGQTFVQETSYGSTWQHQHGIPSLSVSVTSVTVSGSATGGPSDVAGSSTSTLNGRFTAGGANALPDNHTHPLNGVSLAVSASGSGSGSTGTGTAGNTTWIPPLRAVVYCRKD